MTVVLDASAALALLRGESGADAVDEVIGGAIMSTANYTEVVTRLVASGLSAQKDANPHVLDVANTLIALGLTLAPVDTETAAVAGVMSNWSVAYGLSLGDRLCLATAELLHTADEPVTVYTSDKAWARVPVKNLASTIIQIR